MPHINKTKFKPNWVDKDSLEVRHRAKHDKKQKKYRTGVWYALRQIVISRDKVCVYCQENNIVKNGYVVDHIKPISHGGTFDDLNNLQFLCSSCHNKKSAYEKYEKVDDVTSTLYSMKFWTDEPLRKNKENWTII